MKYLSLFLCLVLFACGSKPVNPDADLANLPKPPPTQNPLSQRKLASDEEYIGQSYEKYFLEKNYIDRLKMVRSIIRQLHIDMEEKGRARQNILRKFQTDLDKQIALLQKVETNPSSLKPGWLPDPNSYQYGAKMRALEEIKFSSEVMFQLESYLSATKVMDDDFENFYYRYMRKALIALAEDLKGREEPSKDGLLQAQLSYSDYLASMARSRLHRVFDDKKSRPVVKRLNAFFRQIQAAHNGSEAKAIGVSSEMGYARNVLATADYSNSADIEGSRDDMDNKISTYFGLEMIRYIYGQMN
jgi:hypothetical protein